MGVSDKLINCFWFAYDTVRNYLGKRRAVYYISESKGWVIHAIGKHLERHLRSLVVIRKSHVGVKNSTLHFGSVHTYRGACARIPIHRSNKIVVSWFHVTKEDIAVDYTTGIYEQVDIWHTACLITKNKLIALGIPEEKITLIPLGVSIQQYVSQEEESNLHLREKYDVPKGVFVIGSFQKDGCGWGDGNEPKLIKGPDVLCDVVAQLAKEIDVMVFLTGPSRGYVINRLKQDGVQYKHILFQHAEDVAEIYKLVDVYLIASREEGGPLAVLECMAAGVPVVSTRVGMVPEIIVPGHNGYLVNVEDREALCESVKILVGDEERKRTIVANARETVAPYAWGNITEQYRVKLYGIA